MIVETENLSKRYPRQAVPALRQVTMTVADNRIVGILGPNGAGKTTLLKVITGIARADSGTVRLFSQEPATARARIGFLPEHPQFFRHITATELLRFSLAAVGLPVEAERVRRTLEFVNLQDDAGRPIRQFSKGMLQRIGIAQAVIHEPQLLILDEPMSGLDPLGRRMVIDIITDYHRRGRTILFSTHNLDDIDALCTDVLVLRAGEIHFRERVSELRKRCGYTVTAEGETGLVVREAADEESMWAELAALRGAGLRLVRVQAGVRRMLEAWYEERNG